MACQTVTSVAASSKSACGFLKNQRTNISHRELVALRELSRDLLALTEEQLNERARAKILIEISPEATGTAEPHSPRRP